jgi:NAD(P)-dependent dehydrogenase (short-subunit alcohol dehydrogenase family)
LPGGWWLKARPSPYSTCSASVSKGPPRSSGTARSPSPQSELAADVTEEDWDCTLGINLKGAFLSCQAAAPHLSESGRGQIVMISSDAGRRGAPLLHAYSASKAEMIGLTGSLAGELAPAVTVNCVCPVGVPSTGMGKQMLAWKTGHIGSSPDDVLSGIARGLPLGRNATEDDIVNAVLFFVSEAGSFLTGVALDVDGGASLNTIPGAD